jgi:hypothetical protein
VPLKLKGTEREGTKLLWGTAAAVAMKVAAMVEGMNSVSLASQPPMEQMMMEMAEEAMQRGRMAQKTPRATTVQTSLMPPMEEAKKPAAKELRPMVNALGEVVDHPQANIPEILHLERQVLRTRISAKQVAKLAHALAGAEASFQLP